MERIHRRDIRKTSSYTREGGRVRWSVVSTNGISLKALYEGKRDR